MAKQQQSASGNKLHTFNKSGWLFQGLRASFWSGSLLPDWNSMRFNATESLYESNSMEEVKFTTMYRQSSNTSGILKLICYYLVITSRTCQHCEISKKLTLNPTLTAKNTPVFLFPYTGRSLQVFAWGMPLHAHVFSFTHNAVVLSHFRCVHPENQTKKFSISTFLWGHKGIVRGCSKFPAIITATRV